MNVPPPVVLGLEPALPRPLRGWRWLTDPVPAERAAALRIAVAAVLLFDIFVLYLPNLRSLYGPGGFGDPAHFDGVFGPPSWRWSLLRVLPPGWGPQALLAAWAVAAGRAAGRLPAAAGRAGVLGGGRVVREREPLPAQRRRPAQADRALMLVFLPTDGRWAVRRHPAARGAAGPVLVRAMAGPAR